MEDLELPTDKGTVMVYTGGDAKNGICIFRSFNFFSTMLGSEQAHVLADWIKTNVPKE